MFVIRNDYFHSVEEYIDEKERENAMGNMTNTRNNFGLYLMHINAQSCANLRKFDEIKRFLSEHKPKINILVICETWFKPNECALYNIDGYRALHSCRTLARSAGVSMFISQELKIVSSTIYNSTFNAIKADLNVGNGQSISVSGVYRPPQLSNIEQFFEFSNLLMGQHNKHCICMGDINLNMHALDNKHSREMLHMVKSNGFELCNTHTTREISNSLLDHIYSNCTRHFEHYLSIKWDYSDHNIVIAKMVLSKPLNMDMVQLKHIDYCKASSNFTHLMDNALGATTDINEQYNYISKSLIDSVTAATTTRLVKKRASKCCEWLDHYPRIRQIIAKKKALLKKQRKLVELGKSTVAVRVTLKETGAKLTRLKRTAKSQYYADLFNQANTCREKWKIINGLISNSKKDKQQIVLGAPYDGDESSHFARYFAGVGEGISNSIPAMTGDHPNRLSTITTQSKSVFFYPTSNEEVSCILYSMNSNKSTGVDGISVKLIKCCGAQVSSQLCNLFNEAVEAGIYPDNLKVAKVIPLYKAGPKDQLENYRPISILPALNTIFEKLLYRRIYGFLQSTGFFYEKQFGFRPNSSTKIAIAETIDIIATNLDKKRSTAALFMDPSKAFDCVNHEILLFKLEQAGFRGVTLQLLRSYLTGRKICCSTNGILSEPVGINGSVSQGSVLGPLLYLIYIRLTFKR